MCFLWSCEAVFCTVHVQSDVLVFTLNNNKHEWKSRLSSTTVKVEWITDVYIVSHCLQWYEKNKTKLPAIVKTREQIGKMIFQGSLCSLNTICRTADTIHTPPLRKRLVSTSKWGMTTSTSTEVPRDTKHSMKKIWKRHKDIIISTQMLYFHQQQDGQQVYLLNLVKRVLNDWHQLHSTAFYACPLLAAGQLYLNLHLQSHIVDTM